ncbi:MAG: hypothetical protein CVU39_02295 [Chloroflexi bacterium HGW-Chloroflexi-10]|nr:MAG: hypothetical protein CVU39_02295 [Chloroflexi bacterium HGW-Chloroflexi-10]
MNIRNHQNIFINKWLTNANIFLFASESFIFCLWMDLILYPKQSLITWFGICFSIYTLFAYLTIRLNSLKIKKKIINTLFFLIAVFIIAATLKFIAHPFEQISILKLITHPFQSLIENYVQSQEVLLIFFLLLIITRAVWSATEMLDPSIRIQSFQISTVLLIIFGFFEYSQKHSSNFELVPIFIIFTLPNLLFAQIAENGYQKGGKLPHLSRRWILYLSLITVSLACIGYLSGWMLSNALPGVVKTFYFIVIILIVLLFFLAFAPIWFVINGIIYWVKSLDKNYQPEPFAPFKFVESPIVEEMLTELENVDVLVDYAGTGELILFGLVTISLILFILAFLHKKYWQLNELQFEEKASVSPKSIKNIFNEKKGLKLKQVSIRGKFNEYRIRQIYSAFLMEGQKLNIKHESSETPNEYLFRVNQTIPHLKKEAETITSAYNKIRYGQYPETQEKINSVHIALNKIRAYAKKQKLK